MAGDRTGVDDLALLTALPEAFGRRLDAPQGAIHIQKRHGTWLQKNNHTAASMVHLKLSQSGTVYSAEATDKSKIMLTLHPSAILILKYIPNQQFLSVTSMYLKGGDVDGDELGRYYGKSRPRADGPRVLPVFAPPGVAPTVVQVAMPPGNVVATLNAPASNGPVIVYKKRRDINI